jgi:2'-5' RNA ligase
MIEPVRVPIFIVLVFDGSADMQITELMDAIEASGISTAYQSPTFRGRMPPHVTLGGYNVEKAEDWDELLEQLAGSHRSFVVHLHAVGLFVEAGTVFLAPRINGNLLDVRSAVLSLFEERGLEPRSENLHRERFNPHCTLVPQSTGEQTLRAIDVCRRHWRSIDAVATGIAMIVPPQPIYRRRYLFGGGGEKGSRIVS